jgi:hypothetical protein
MSKFDVFVSTLLEAAKSKQLKDKKSKEYLAHRDEIIAKSEFKNGDPKKGAKFMAAARELRGKKEDSKK